MRSIDSLAREARLRAVLQLGSQLQAAIEKREQVDADWIVAEPEHRKEAPLS
jgi:hypothetical protein